MLICSIVCMMMLWYFNKLTCDRCTEAGLQHNMVKLLMLFFIELAIQITNNKLGTFEWFDCWCHCANLSYIMFNLERHSFDHCHFCRLQQRHFHLRELDWTVLDVAIIVHYYAVWICIKQSIQPVIRTWFCLYISSYHWITVKTLSLTSRLSVLSHLGLYKINVIIWRLCNNLPERIHYWLNISIFWLKMRWKIPAFYSQHLQSHYKPEKCKMEVAT